jgi:uncharacterized protein (TIGR03437 family)
MSPGILTRIAQVAAIGAALPILLLAYLSGLDAGVAGVPEEDTCTDCHNGPSGSGSVTVTFPGTPTYTPGARQHLVVNVVDGAQKRWGFQLTARQANSSTTQAGTFTPGADGYTQLVCTQTDFRSQAFGNTCTTNGMALQYIEHTESGSRLGTAGAVTFEFDWTPPATDVGNLVVYIAALAANGDDTPHGDHTYTARYTLTSPSAVPAPQPAISTGGVFNAASFQPGVSAGSWVTIQGSNLAGNTRSWGADDFAGAALPTQLDGVSVKIDGKPAYVAFISPAQINVQAPADSALGPVPVEVTFNGSASSPGTAQLQAVSPGFFLWSGKYAVATHPDFSPAAPAGLFPGVTTVPAKPGEWIVLWGTGFGATTPTVTPGIVPPANPLANVANPVTATIGNIAATVVGAAISPGSPGLYQIAVQVPPAAPDGDLPVVAQVNGVQSSSSVLLNVKR